jgi:predicted dehydrogenase
MGTEGRLDITHPYNAIAECKAWMTRDEKVQDFQLPEGPLYAGEIENMNDVVLESRPQVFTLEDSRKALETILALRKSACLE